MWHSDLAQVAALAAVVAAWMLDAVRLAPVVAVLAVAMFNIVAVRGPVRRAVVIGMQQMAFGIAVTVVTAIAVAIVHYLNGAIRLQPLGERVTPNAKAHLSVLLALAAFTKAADYWLRRFELVVSGGTTFDGAGYTDINAALPAIQLMMLISVFAGVLLLINIRRKGWTLPIIILALWGLVAIIAGGLYPAFVQRFQVAPNEQEAEAESMRTAGGQE